MSRDPYAIAYYEFDDSPKYQSCQLFHLIKSLNHRLLILCNKI